MSRGVTKEQNNKSTEKYNDPTTWRIYKGAWIFLEESKEKILSGEESKEILKNGGLMIRNTYDFDTKEETSFWYVIKDKLEDISELPFSARRNIRRAHKFYNFTKTNKKTIIDNCYDILLSRQKSYRVKSKIMTQKEFISMLEEYENENIIDYWIIEKKVTNEIVGFSINRIKENSCDYDFMSCKPESLRNRTYPYYGLIYEMNRHYLGENKLRYVSDGSRSITEHSNIQSFLIHNFKFRKAYCKLKVYYKWWFGVVVKMLFPFRNIIPLRNVRAILMMEEYSRSFE